MLGQIRISELISEKEIAQKVQEIGNKISARFKGEELTAICVLKGGFMFYADLIRSVENDLCCEFFGISSYQGSQSSGEVKMTLDLAHPVEGKNVLLVEDIVDTGLSMNYLIKTLGARMPKNLVTAALLVKPGSLKVPCKIDYQGFEVGDEFVVGYGLDYQGYYRNLPYVAKIENMN